MRKREGKSEQEAGEEAEGQSASFAAAVALPLAAPGLALLTCGFRAAQRAHLLVWLFVKQGPEGQEQPWWLWLQLPTEQALLPTCPTSLPWGQSCRTLPNTAPGSLCRGPGLSPKGSLPFGLLHGSVARWQAIATALEKKSGLAARAFFFWGGGFTTCWSHLAMSWPCKDLASSSVAGLDVPMSRWALLEMLPGAVQMCWRKGSVLEAA